MDKYTRALEIFTPTADSPLTIPVATASVQGGFPSPADDYIEKSLDLNELVVRHPAATFYVRVEGNSMEGAGIYSGDILVVDRSLPSASGKIIIAILNGEFTVKRLITEGKQIFLHPENPQFQRIEVKEESDFQVWGVVTYVIHKAS
jgi:DNA polymerase V